MISFEQATQQFQQFLATGNLTEAEHVVDEWAAMDGDELGEWWELDKNGARHYLSIFFNNLGAKYQAVGIQAHQQNQREDMQLAAHGAERCHEKALNLYDLSAEDFLYFPAHSPLNKNLIFTFWGLGSAKYVLGKPAESRKYLLLCLRISPEDEQATYWQADASNYLRLLDQKPVHLVLKAQDVMPNPLNPQLLKIEGEVLEWGAYGHPRLQTYLIMVSDEDITRLAAKGFRNAIALEGHTLVLCSHESGDLRKPLALVDVI